MDFDNLPPTELISFWTLGNLKKTWHQVNFSGTGKRLQKPYKFIAKMSDFCIFAKNNKTPRELMHSWRCIPTSEKLEIPSEHLCFGGSKTAKGTKKVPRD